jgi:hypothetical protein
MKQRNNNILTLFRERNASRDTSHLVLKRKAYAKTFIFKDTLHSLAIAEIFFSLLIFLVNIITSFSYVNQID